jgi:ferredoxin
VADPADRWPDNVPGEVVLRGRGWSFYVDRSCILCSVCSDAAPRNFRRSDDEDHDICYKQPETEQELIDCLEAEASCPVEAIGSS